MFSVLDLRGMRQLKLARFFATVMHFSYLDHKKFLDCIIACHDCINFEVHTLYLLRTDIIWQGLKLGQNKKKNEMKCIFFTIIHQTGTSIITTTSIFGLLPYSLVRLYDLFLLILTKCFPLHTTVNAQVCWSSSKSNLIPP